MRKKHKKIFEIIGIFFSIFIIMIITIYILDLIKAKENNQGILINFGKKYIKDYKDELASLSNQNVVIEEVEEIEEEIVEKTKLEELPENYNYLKAIKDKCVVSMHGTKIYNKDEIDKFLEKIDKGKPYSIRTINYTTEGDMIITDVEFDGNDSYLVRYDNTRDNFSTKEYQKGEYAKLVVNRQSFSTTIFLSEKIEGDLGDKVTITFYNNDVKIINNYDINYLLDIKKSEKAMKRKITIDELNKKYDYDIYYYGVESCTIDLNNKIIDLKNALIENKVTMEQVIEQAENDVKNDIITSDIYYDGGSKIYHYDTYAIIKNNKTDGNRDVYIGIPEMRLDLII